MKKRILSLVLCAALLLSLCLFMGAGVAADAAADMAEIAGTVEDTQSSPTVGPILPLVVTRPQTSPYRAARAPSLADTGETQDDGLKLTKTVTPKADGGYTVHLEAYTTGTVTTSTTTKPCDIVLVLDQSGSMAYDFNGNSTNNDTSRRQYAMKQAVNQFIGAVADKYDAEKSDHRISIVTFGSDASVLQGWTPVSQDGKKTLQGEITGLPSTPSGATNVGDGMKQAETLMGSGYNYTGSNTTRQKVVVVFTDGVPTTQSDFNTTVANTAIKSAKALKDSGATVYSVGIFNGAKPEQLYGDSGFKYNSNGQVGSCWASFSWWGIGDVKNYDIPAGNRFLNYISGNFPDATEIGIQPYDSSFLGIGYYGWEITRNFNRASSSYYLTANDSASLSRIFTTISENIGQASIDLSSSTVVKDIVTPYFTMPANTADVKLYTADYNGTSFGMEQPAGSDVRATIDANTNTVSVTGFDFNKYYVADKQHEGTYGKKLIIEFSVQRKPGFVGGNNVPTNGDTSGVYTEKGVSAGLFDVPKVNVPIIAPELAGQDCHVYYLGTQPTPEQMCTPYDTAGSDFSFVKVSYTTSGSVDMTQDGSYTVTATVSPKEEAASDSAGASAQPATATVTSTVYVYKPELTFQDGEGYYGDTVPGFDGNLTATVWKHGETEANTDAMGAAPALTLTYTPDADAIVDGKINTRMDFGVAAAVKIGETDVTANTTFKHTPCEGKTCTLPDGTAFLCHVNTCSLKISKAVTGDGANPNQTFVFDVKDSTGKLVTTIVLKDGEQKTITGLAVGTYTVTEDTNWSWSYSIVGGNSKTAALSSTTTSAVVDVTNHYNSHNWLTSIADVINTWISGSAAQKN